MACPCGLVVIVRGCFGQALPLEGDTSHPLISCCWPSAMGGANTRHTNALSLLGRGARICDGGGGLARRCMGQLGTPDGRSKRGAGRERPVIAGAPGGNGSRRRTRPTSTSGIGTSTSDSSCGSEGRCLPSAVPRSGLLCALWAGCAPRSRGWRRVVRASGLPAYIYTAGSLFGSL